MHLFEGETKNYSEDLRVAELVLVDKSDPNTDMVYSISQHLLAKQKEIRNERLPFTVKVQKFWPNADLIRPVDTPPTYAIKSGATSGALKDISLVPLPPVTDMDSRNMPSAVVEIADEKGSAGSFLVSALVSSQQSLNLGGRQYQVELRFRRYYYPFALTLLKATHEKYRGTEIPKNFASRVRVQDQSRNEVRETMIYMNNPLRHDGLTLYQYQMSAGDMAERAGMAPSSTLQVVRNPGWLTPYLSCIMVATGLLVQFGIHLVGFLKRRLA
jgi:hypothetical protein